MTTATPLILVINCGSSSLKFALQPVGSTDPILSGLAECLGLEDSRIIIKGEEGKSTQSLNGGRHAEAMEVLTRYLAERDLLSKVAAIGHRIVHGGERFTASALVTEEVLAGIEECCELAPLHNPGHLVGIRAAQKAFPQLKQVVVFDTAFHQTMQPAVYRYAVAKRFYTDYHVRRYGMHGTSCRYVTGETIRVLDLDPAEHGIIICHLGNGASATAVRNGQCVDTTMGMTPLEGLIMGTRSGDIDPAAVTYIARRENLDLDGIDTLLNKQSGLLGISGVSSDCRALEEAAAAGNADAILALDMFAHRLARLVGGLATSLQRLDALVFTGGIGENSSLLRAKTLAHLSIFGFKIDEAANEAAIRGKAGVITAAGSPVAVVVNTNEECMIARDTAELAGIHA
ncbi:MULTISPECIES: acetate/propionate family kinase [unclassified Paludibacterium]|uniref:acetate/propionate family kinase n=1 Tax=unclassified Paludibacterium TaxID=2618429 RepID=UPI001C044049|nr:acetate kinase [Paludibacterium sp. B53371]BEV73081.1 acetate kinase [Paludibacterium sp. THUN1379]